MRDEICLIYSILHQRSPLCYKKVSHRNKITHASVPCSPINRGYPYFEGALSRQGVAHDHAAS